jgi:ferredoxin
MLTTLVKTYLACKGTDSTRKGHRGTMRIIADTDRCIGSGQCLLKEPTVFDLDEEEGIVVLLSSRPTGSTAERAREATRLCPSGALTVIED